MTTYYNSKIDPNSPSSKIDWTAVCHTLIFFVLLIVAIVVILSKLNFLSVDCISGLLLLKYKTKVYK